MADVITMELDDILAAFKQAYEEGTYWRAAALARILLEECLKKEESKNV